MRSHAEEAAVARCDLYILYAVIAILEGGTVSAELYDETQKIIAICKSGSAKALRRYDRSLAKVKSA